MLDTVIKEELLLVLEPAFNENGYIQKYVPLIEKHIDKSIFDIYIIGSESGLKTLRQKYSHIYSIPFYPHAKGGQLFLGYATYLLYALFMTVQKSSKNRVIVSLGGHPYSGFIASFAGKLRGRKTIIRISEPTRFLVKKRYTIGPLIARIISLQERLTFTFADRIIVNRDMVWYSKVLTKKQVLLSQGIDLSKFNSQVLPSLVNSSYPKLITVARLDKQKNIESVIEAVSLLKGKYPNIKYYVVGEGPDENLLRLKVSMLNLSESVFFYGSINPDDIPGLLRSADFFVLPSNIEGLPSAALEAMACGVPILLSSNEFGCSSWFIHRENAMLVEGDSKSIVEAIDELIVEKSLKERLIDNALKFIKKYHDSSKTKRKFAQLYKNLKN